MINSARCMPLSNQDLLKCIVLKQSTIIIMERLGQYTYFHIIVLLHYFSLTDTTYHILPAGLQYILSYDDYNNDR